jgi:hypothetical protein
MANTIYTAPKKKLRVLKQYEAEQDLAEAKKKYKYLSSAKGLTMETIKGLPQAAKKVLLNAIALKVKKKK